MPKYTIYIRDEDNDKWLAIIDKPQFLHGAIKDYMSLTKSGDLDVLKYIVDDRTATTVYETAPILEEHLQELEFKKMCKHGSAKELCKFGCR